MNEIMAPKTLKEAIRIALLVGPLSEAEDRVILAVKDFMAVQFQAVMLITDHVTEAILKNLYDQITSDLGSFAQGLVRMREIKELLKEEGLYQVYREALTDELDRLECQYEDVGDGHGKE